MPSPKASGSYKAGSESDRNKKSSSKSHTDYSSTPNGSEDGHRSEPMMNEGSQRDGDTASYVSRTSARAERRVVALKNLVHEDPAEQEEINVKNIEQQIQKAARWRMDVLATRLELARSAKQELDHDREVLNELRRRKY